MAGIEPGRPSIGDFPRLDRKTKFHQTGVKKLKPVNKHLAVIAIAAFTLFSLPAQTEDLTIGVVNTSRIIKESPQGKKALMQLQKEFSDRRQKLVSEENQLKKMQQKMKKDSVIMSQTEMQNLQGRIRRKQHDLKRDQQTFQEDLQYERKQKLSSIKKLIVQAIQTVARNDGYDLVMGQTVAYASNQVNITDEVLAYLKKKAG